jgi:hypothetical protein
LIPTDGAIRMYFKQKREVMFKPMMKEVKI